MSRRKQEQPDSLEMLLDTMCNAFGGIILIAILLALLARSSDVEKGNKPPSPDDVRIKNEIQIATNLMAGLTMEAIDLAEQAEGIDPAKTNLWNTLTNLITVADNWSNRVSQLDGTGAVMTSAVADSMAISNKITILERMIDNKQAELEIWKTKEGDAKDGREKIKVRAPEENRADPRKSVIAVIQDGRFIPIQKYLPNGGGNLDPNFILRKPDGSFEPKPNSGWPLPDKADQWARFRNISLYLSNFPRNNSFCQLFVDDKSFKEARVLRQAMAKMRIGSGWVPIWKKPLIFRTDGGGATGPGPDG